MERKNAAGFAAFFSWYFPVTAGASEMFCISGKTVL